MAGEAWGRASKARRGRPPKFGRPSRVVALTLPEDTVEWLHGIHPDLGWAIVRLHRTASRRRTGGAARRVPPAELAFLPGQRALIVVRPDLVASLPGVSTIPLEDGRAFLALDAGHGIADLELALRDRIEDLGPRAVAKGLLELAERIRTWRRDATLAIRSRAVIVIEHSTGVVSGPLVPLREDPARARPRMERPRRGGRR